MWAPFRRLLLDLLATHATEQMQFFGDLAAIADNHRLHRLLHCVFYPVMTKLA
jgi:hypothetical protein